MQVFDREHRQAGTDFTSGDLFLRLMRTRRLTSDESDQSDVHQQALSHLSFLTSRMSSFSGAEASTFFCFPAGFLYNCPRTVTSVAESTSGSRPLDNSFGTSA